MAPPAPERLASNQGTESDAHITQQGELSAVPGRHAQYLTTNRHILEGKNPFVKFGQKGAFSLTTPTQEDAEAEPLQTFFPERHYVPMLEVLATVNRYSNFLDEFQHWQQRHHRGRPSPKVFYAGLIGIGCAIGSRKMARISRPINESDLEHTINWYFSVDNAHAANDQVLRLIDRLELPNLSRSPRG